MKRKTRRKFSCDFETTTKKDDCRVWAYGWMEIGNTKNYKIGNNIEEFMAWCEQVKADLYFHNLKFDGEFIVNWLLHNGWKHSEDGEPGTFKTVISNMLQWYIIDICYGYKGKEKQHTVIYDSMKKLPMKVKAVAQGFKLDVMKGDIDYHLERPPGHIITPEEHEYIKNDIEIIAKALQEQFNQGLKKITNGSDALNGFKDIVTKELFDKYFPLLDREKIDKNMRLFYRGGFTWLYDKYAGKEIEKGIVFDVNSLYPSIMYSKPLPYGFPLFFDGKYEHDNLYPLYMQVVECEFEIKENKIPTIQLKKTGIFSDNEYLKSSNGERVKLYVTNVDWELIQEHYHLYDVEYINGWKFKQKTGLFNDYIAKWMYIKNNNKGAKKVIAKLMLNSLYGKFATNPKVTGKKPYLKEDGSTGYTLPKDEHGNTIDEFKKPVYTPMGVFITSWARHTTITAAQACYDRIIYCDTDSIHLTGDSVPDAIKQIVHEDKLGFWKHEGTFKKAKFIRQKTYLEQYEYRNAYRYVGKTVIWHKGIFKHFGWWIPMHTYKGKTVKLWCPRPDIKCAGMNDIVKMRVNYRNFKVGFTSHGRLTPKRVPGGVVLEDTVFTIK